MSTLSSNSNQRRKAAEERRQADEAKEMKILFPPTGYKNKKSIPSIPYDPFNGRLDGTPRAQKLEEDEQRKTVFLFTPFPVFLAVRRYFKHKKQGKYTEEHIR